ncbi:hypothetical protein PTUN_a4062 [Pseudoalteromonas tunicata]|jgi:hypothetical protein|nr:hypothetical protein PTUN_a4062 [Pseudoalteromonas tunicata]
MTLLGIAAVALFLMAYLYFRGENYRKELMIYRRRTEIANKEGRELSQQVHDFARAEFIGLKECFTRLQTGGVSEVHMLRFATILFDAGDHVIKEATLGNQTTHDAFKDYINKFSQYGYGDFKGFLSAESEFKQQLWAKNNLQDFLKLCKACLQDLEH